MFKSSLFAFALTVAGSAAAQTVVAPAAPAAPAATADSATTGAAASQSLPRCSAELRDRCVQDERFASDVARPGGSRDNNAMRYPSSADAERGQPR